jgi:hypothetical protein
MEVTRAALPRANERDPSKWLHAAILRGEGIADDQSIWLFAPHRELAFSKPVFRSEVRGNVLELKASPYCHGVHLDDEGGGCCRSAHAFRNRAHSRHERIAGDERLRQTDATMCHCVLVERAARSDDSPGYRDSA